MLGPRLERNCFPKWCHHALFLGPRLELLFFCTMAPSATWAPPGASFFFGNPAWSNFCFFFGPLVAWCAASEEPYLFAGVLVQCCSFLPGYSNYYFVSAVYVLVQLFLVPKPKCFFLKLVSWHQLVCFLVNIAFAKQLLSTCKTFQRQTKA